MTTDDKQIELILTVDRTFWANVARLALANDTDEGTVLRVGVTLVDKMTRARLAGGRLVIRDADGTIRPLTDKADADGNPNQLTD